LLLIGGPQQKMPKQKALKKGRPFGVHSCELEKQEKRQYKYADHSCNLYFFSAKENSLVNVVFSGRNIAV
jgi:hypothetical protein